MAAKAFERFSHAEKHIPQPEMLEVQKKKSSFTIGVPKEIAFQENRIALVPEAVAMLVNNGLEVRVEAGAGKAAHFPDHEFSEAGALIVYSPEEAYQADVILKVAPPLPSEAELFRQRQTLFSALHITGQQAEYFKRLTAKKTTAISYEHIKDKTNSFPVIRSLSEIAGNASIFIAAEYLADTEYGKGKIFGGFSGITPTEVVILGAGSVAEYAARAALGMGALVRIFDDNIFKIRSIQTKLGNRVFTSVIQNKALTKALRTADVVIGALHAHDARTPCVISEDMIREMTYGSVIVDVSIVQGGCCETSRVTNHTQPVYKKHGITHYAVPNIASRYPNTSSLALSNFFAPIMLRIAEAGGIEGLLKSDAGIRHGVYLYNGMLTNKYISDLYGIPYKDLDLLMAAFQ